MLGASQYVVQLSPSGWAEANFGGGGTQLIRKVLALSKITLLKCEIYSWALEPHSMDSLSHQHRAII